MQDEHFIRDWVGARNRFSSGGVSRPQGAVDRDKDSRDGSRIIRRTYAAPTTSEVPTPLSAAARASLRGVTATVLTFMLWATVMVLATPAPGLASPLSEAGCTAQPVLA